jgi:membrane protease YdiL (CAAX protease family)
MNTSTHTSTHRPVRTGHATPPGITTGTPDDPELRPLIWFVVAALPVGWVLLSVPLVLDAPLAPFVLGTLYLGLVLPTVLLTRRDPHTSMRQLLRDTVRLPRPAWLLVPAGLAIPTTTYGLGAVLGHSADVTIGFVVNLAVANVLSSVLIVNLWEEMAWAGFVQRRLGARWGFAIGAMATAVLFTGIHLPLSLYGAEDLGDVGHNIAVMLGAGAGMRLLIGAFDTWGQRSILALAFIHATFNASSELLDDGSDWVRYTATLALGLLAWALWHAMSMRARRSDQAGRAATPGTTGKKVTR